MILRVAPRSAAAAAGLEGTTVASDGTVVPGDIIVEVKGKPVGSVGKLLSRLDDFNVGDTVRLTVLRGGGRTEVPVRLQPEI